MIYGIFHKGSGLGNQLHRYIATRVLAADKGYDFSMIGVDNFKGKSFLNLNMGVQPSLPFDVELPSGKVIPQSEVPMWEEKTSDYNSTYREINDHTIIDGEFQGEKYFEHRRNDIDKWLAVDPIDTILPENLSHTCVICFRGGEYTAVPELFLPRSYWYTSMEYMRQIDPQISFVVVTDDLITAKNFFPNLTFMDEINGKHDMGIDWRITRHAPYLILSNASFYIFPAWLNSTAKIIAPKNWARFNTDKWTLEQNKYKDWFYQDKLGNLQKI